MDKGTRVLYTRVSLGGNWIVFIPILCFLFLVIISFFLVDTNQLALTGLTFSFCFFLNVFLFRREALTFVRCFNVKEHFDILALIVFMFYVLVSVLWSRPDDTILIYKEIVRIAVSLGLLLFFLSSSKLGIAFDFMLRITFVAVLTLIGICLAYEPIQAIVSNPNQGTYYWDVQLAILKPGILYHQATVAWMYGLSLFLSLSLMPYADRLTKYALYFSCLIALIMTVFAHSRGAYLGVVAGLMYYFLSQDIRKFFNFIMIVFFLILGFLSIYFLADIEAVDRLIDRADSGRWEIWRNALSRIMDRPFFGYGFASTSINQNDSFVAMHYHSLYIGTLVYGGVTGLILFLLAVAGVLVLNFGVARNRGWYSILIMSLVVFIFDGNHILTYPSAELYIFLIPVLSMALNRLQFDDDNSKRLTVPRTEN